MTFIVPCARPENKPDDWFIDKDGGEAEALEDGVALGVDEIAENLVRRRHAKDKCHVDCILRLQCLDIGMRPENMRHGTFGGYHVEERRKIRKAMAERAKRRPEGLD